MNDEEKNERIAQHCLSLYIINIQNINWNKFFLLFFLFFCSIYCNNKCKNITGVFVLFKFMHENLYMPKKNGNKTKQTGTFCIMDNVLQFVHQNYFKMDNYLQVKTGDVFGQFFFHLKWLKIDLIFIHSNRNQTNNYFFFSRFWLIRSYKKETERERERKKPL